MRKANIVDCYVQSDKVSEDRTFAISSDWHLTMNDKGFVGVENLEKMLEVLSGINFDYLLVPGDAINDTKDLENDVFCNYFLNYVKQLSQGKLSFFSLGNHDLMTMGANGWEKGNENKLSVVLGDLSNAVILNKFASFNLNTVEGYPKANINIIGASLPYEYYEGDKESDLSFLNYWNNMKARKGNIFDNNSYNILMFHALEQFVKISRADGKCIFPEIAFATGGHYHNGSIPNWLGKYIPGNSGIISPQMKLFPKDIRGFEQVDNTLVHMGSFTNFRVESGLMNKVAGGPYILLLHVQPLEKGKKSGHVRVKSRFV